MGFDSIPMRTRFSATSRRAALRERHLKLLADLRDFWGQVRDTDDRSRILSAMEALYQRLCVLLLEEEAALRLQRHPALFQRVSEHAHLKVEIEAAIRGVRLAQRFLPDQAAHVFDPYVVYVVTSAAQTLAPPVTAFAMPAFIGRAGATPPSTAQLMEPSIA